MAKLIYFMLTSLAISRMKPATPIRRRRTRRYLLSSTISCVPSACISMDARYTRRWRFGRHQTSFLAAPGHAGLRADLASGRQDRLFQIAGDRLKTEDPSRDEIRPTGGVASARL